MCQSVFFKDRSCFLLSDSGGTFSDKPVNGSPPSACCLSSLHFQPHYPSLFSFTEDNRGAHSCRGISGQLNLPRIVSVASKLSFSYKGSASASCSLPEIRKMGLQRRFVWEPSKQTLISKYPDDQIEKLRPIVKQTGSATL